MLLKAALKANSNPNVVPALFVQLAMSASLVPVLPVRAAHLVIRG